MKTNSNVTIGHYILGKSNAATSHAKSLATPTRNTALRQSATLRKTKATQLELKATERRRKDDMFKVNEVNLQRRFDILKKEFLKADVTRLHLLSCESKRVN